MLLISFLCLIATLTSVYGDCVIGPSEVDDFDWNKVGVWVLTWFLKQAALKLLLLYYISLVFPFMISL